MLQTLLMITVMCNPSLRLWECVENQLRKVRNTVSGTTVSWGVVTWMEGLDGTFLSLLEVIFEVLLLDIGDLSYLWCCSVLGYVLQKECKNLESVLRIIKKKMVWGLTNLPYRVILKTLKLRSLKNHRLHCGLVDAFTWSEKINKVDVIRYMYWNWC